MSLKADVLKENEVQKKSISREVKNILGHIDDKIKVAHEAGVRDPVKITVPINFNIPYMSNKDSQRRIYYLLIKDLKERGFHVKVKLEENSTVFIVSWLSEQERDEIEYETAVILEHIEKKC